MTTTINDSVTWSPTSPKHAPIRQVLPDSPDYSEKYTTNSDDLQPTSDLHASSLLIDTQITKPKSNNTIIIVGSHERTITLGRGGSNTIKIGRRNRQISRTHVSITFSQQNEQFELTVVGLNGACVDHVNYGQHAIAPLDHDSFIDILGDHFYFKIPPPPLNFTNIKEDEPVVINKNTDIFRELSPEAEEEQEEEEQQEDVVIAEEKETMVLKKEEEEYPVELVPEDALSSDEKELSPEPPIVEKVEKKMPLQERKQEVIEEDTNDYAEVIIDALGKKESYTVEK